MCRFHQRNAAGTGRHIDVEHLTDNGFAYVTLTDGQRTIKLPAEPDALEASAQAMLIAARRIREAAQ